MNLSMFDQERIWLEGMNGSPLPQSVITTYERVREKLLLAGHSMALGKESLAILSALAGNIQPPERDDPEPERRQEVIPVREQLTPEEDLNDDEWEKAGRRFQTNGTHEYIGQRTEWKNPFMSVPGDPVNLWEKGRPITYYDADTGAILPARFVKVSERDPSMGVISSSKMKKNYSVPIKQITLNDLSPPSTIPAAVQV